MIPLIELLKFPIQDFALEYRIHATKRMFERDISENDIESVLTAGRVIEDYKDDFPLPSVLICGRSKEERPLHIVVGINQAEKILVIITAYEPDPEKWISDFSRRQK
jgi:hypothetical protein